MNEHTGNTASTDTHREKEAQPAPNDQASEGKGGWDPDDERMMALLAAGYTHARVAEEVGTCAKTVQRRLQLPGFKERVDELKRDLHAESWSRLLGLRDKALGVLDAAMDSNIERTRLQAARTVFELGTRIRKEQASEEILDRVKGLESELAARTDTETRA